MQAVIDCPSLPHELQEAVSCVLQGHQIGAQNPAVAHGVCLLLCEPDGLSSFPPSGKNWGARCHFNFNFYKSHLGAACAWFSGGEVRLHQCGIGGFEAFSQGC